ncbi:ammonium transporter [Planosporangium sp. 12N6]|uniref:ammonium transporter n=1 Tax=Planosporangium spinosum TaxID=3402278 RepID=UPI003CE88054
MNPGQGSWDVGATAWVLACTALVLVMTPAVAFFYGGLVRQKNVLGMVMQSFATIGVVTLMWAAIGFSFAFGSGRLLGGFELAGLTGTDARLPGFAHLAVPVPAFVVFQLMIAVVTPVLVTGATAERWRFEAYLLFVALWTVLVYAPVAHWVFSPEGWAHRLGVLDFAGGTVVHVNAGAAALAAVWVLGRRRGWPGEPQRPHNLPLVMIGAGLLWFGWFGLTGGSALAANGVAATAVLNTQLGAGAALLVWIAIERARFGKGTTLGAASGAVTGLVAVTPAAGYVTSLGAVVIGLLAGTVCQLAIGLKSWFGLDDSLDVVAVHLGGGVVGTLAVGLFATRSVNPDGADGLFYGGGYRLVGAQLVAVCAVVAYSLVLSGLLGSLTNRLLGNRVDPRDEAVGLDLSQHGESAYEIAPPRARACAPVPVPNGPGAARTRRR